MGLDIHLSEELVQECTAREFVNRVQNMRKDAGLEVADRIRVWGEAEEPVAAAVEVHRDYICAETLAVELKAHVPSQPPLLEQEWEVNGHRPPIYIARA